MKKIIFTYKDWTCQVNTAQYSQGRLALRVVDIEDGQPICTASVNLPKEECEIGHCYIKDYSENEGILNALVCAGIVSSPIKRIMIDFDIEVPYVKFLKSEQ